MSNQHPLNAFNYEAALHSLNGDVDTMCEMLQMLVDELPDQRIQLERLANERNWESLEMLTHTLCGSAIYLGLEQLNLIARKITTSLRENNYSKISNDIEKLQNAIDEVLKAIENKVNITPSPRV